MLNVLNYDEARARAEKTLARLNKQAGEVEITSAKVEVSRLDYDLENKLREMYRSREIVSFEITRQMREPHQVIEISTVGDIFEVIDKIANFYSKAE